ncbi:MAG: PAS domain S-box protein [Bacteroidota bacterium]
MELLPNTNLVATLRRAANILSVAVAGIGVAVVIGWLGDITALKSILPHWPAMKINTAIGICLGGISLLLLTGNQSSALKNQISFAFSIVVLIIGAVTFLQDALGQNFRIDQLLMHEPVGSIATSSPGRMSPASALDLILIGAALMIASREKNRSFTQLCAASAQLLSILGLTGYYLYGSPLAIPGFALSAFHETIAFILLSLAILFAWSGTSWMAVVTSDTVGGITARNLLPAAIATPIFLGWLRLGGHKINLYPVEIGMALLIVSIMLFLVAVIWKNAEIQTKIDLRRKEQEIRLRDSESMLQTVLTLLPVGVSITDKEGTIILENPANREIWAETSEQTITNYRAYTGSHAESGKPVKPSEWAVAHALNEGTTTTGEIIEIHKLDGSHKNILNSALPIHDSENTITGAIIVNEDITELRRAQQSLEKQAQLLNLVYDAVIVKSTGDERITYWNRGAEEMYGWNIVEAAGKQMDALLETSFTETRESIIDILLKSGRWEGELIQRKKDGTPITVLSRWTIERDRTGTPIGILEINNDITARKHMEDALQKANEGLEKRVKERTARLANINEELKTEISVRMKVEAQLRRSREQYSLLAENIPELVFTARQDGYVEYCNRRWYDFTGTNPDIPLGRGWESVIHPDDLKTSIDTWTQSVTKGIAYDFQLRFRRADGAYRWHIIRAIPWRNNEGKIMRWFGTCTDIDAQKQAEREIKRFNEELERRVARRTEELTSANKELEAFTYSVSHDLRSPLRHIEGFITMLMEDLHGALDEPDLQHLNSIAVSSQHMGTMIDGLLAFSRLGKTEVATTIVQPGELVNEIIRNMEQELKDRSITWNIQSLPPVKADPVLLRLALTNLISNSVKYTGKLNQACIDIGALPRQGNHETFYIRDNGVGFDMTYSDKLFGVFQRLHSEDEFEGLGIGLANVRRIIEKHGGKIWAEGKVDSGATFYFTLPSADELIRS